MSSATSVRNKKAQLTALLKKHFPGRRHAKRIAEYVRWVCKTDGGYFRRSQASMLDDFGDFIENS